MALVSVITNIFSSARISTAGSPFGILIGIIVPQLIEFYEYCQEKVEAEEDKCELYWFATLFLEETQVVKMYRDGQLYVDTTQAESIDPVLLEETLTEEDIAQIEKAVGQAEPISKMLEKNMTLQQIAETVTGDDNLMVMLKKINPKYECNCNKDRFLKGLATLKKEELEEIFEAQETIETTCEFCNKKYEFTKEEVLG